MVTLAPWLSGPASPEKTRDKSRERCFDHAFTLIEIVVALTIVVVITAVAIPTIKGIGRAEQARAPIRTLAEMVQEVRQRAMREGEPYQIVFEREGIHASPQMYPYEKREEYLKALEDSITPPKDEGFERTVVEHTAVQVQEAVGGSPTKDLEPTAPVEKEWHWEPPWTQNLPIHEGTECELLMWGDGEWDLIEGEEMRRWIFQPSGMASPLRVRLRTGEFELEAGFDVLTGELTKERAGQPVQKP